MQFLRSLLPVRKVSSATVGALSGQVIVYAINTKFPEFMLTADQAAYITVGTTFIAGWLMPSKKDGRHEANIPVQRTNETEVRNRGISLPVGPAD